jgi:type IV pilus assembly protein PilV
MNGRRSGFTLMSVIIAIVLVIVGLVAMSRTQTVVASMHTDTMSRTTALSIGRAYMEQVRGRDPWTLISESEVVVDDMGEPNAAGHYKRWLDVTVEAPNLLRATVNVSGPRLSAPLQLVTYVYRGAR